MEMWQDPENLQKARETVRKRVETVSNSSAIYAGLSVDEEKSEEKSDDHPGDQKKIKGKKNKEKKKQEKKQSCCKSTGCLAYWWEISTFTSFLGVVILFIAMSYYEYTLRLSFGSAEDITKQRDFQIVAGIGGIVLLCFMIQLAVYIGWRVIKITNKRDEMEEIALKSMKSMYMTHTNINKYLCQRSICLCLMIALLINSTILCIVVFSYECGYASTYNVASSVLLYEGKLKLQIGSDPTAVEQTNSDAIVPFLKQQTNKIVADLMKEAPNGYSFSWHECQCFDAVAAKYSRDACTETTCVLASDTITIECIAPASCELNCRVAVGGIANGINEHYTEPINITMRVESAGIRKRGLAEVGGNSEARVQGKPATSKKSKKGSLDDLIADGIKQLFIFCGQIYITFFTYTIVLFGVFLLVIYVMVECCA